MDKVDTIIIGAGVVGLAIARELGADGKSVFVLEQESAHGRGISSRNSEVIHAGIYYPPNTLKARLCVTGARKFFEWAEAGHIPLARHGKLIVAGTPEERADLERLHENGTQNGARDLTLLTAEETRAKEPALGAVCGALFSPHTAVTNAHAVMDFLCRSAEGSGVDVVYNARVCGIQHSLNGFKVEVCDSSGEIVELAATAVVNAAGLYADTVAELCGIDTSACGYTQYFCKGDYFNVHSRYRERLHHLIYPVPSARTGGLGIHATLDLNGSLRLGPDFYSISREEQYAVDENKRVVFFDAVHEMLSFLNKEDLAPDFSGIRPELSPEKGVFNDFIIREESDKGYPGLISLIGIASPGLTASPAIACYVRDLLSAIGV